MTTQSAQKDPQRRDLLKLTLAAVGAGVLPEWGALAAPGARVLTVARLTDMRTLDPSYDSSDVGFGLFKYIFDQLTAINADGSVAPRLAETWQGNADATEWTFRIRDDAVFHDGTKLTVADVLFTYQRLIDDAATAVHAYVAFIASVTAPDDRTVVFRLKAPFAPFDRQASLISILPKHAYPLANPAPFATAPIGSGPYKVVAWVKDDRLALQAHDGYWAAAPAIRQVVIRPIPNEQSRVAGLRTGELDIVPSLPPASLSQLSNDPAVKVTTVASIRTIYIGFNMKNPVFASLALRRGIDMAIDRQAIADRLLRGLGKPEGQLVAPVTFGYDPAIKPTEFRPDLGQQLVKQSGYDGTTILLQYPNNRWPFATEVAQAIAGYLQRIGVKTELQGMEYTALFPLWAVQNLPGMHIFGFGPTIMDSALVINSLINTRSTWDDPECKRLYAEQLATIDPVARRGKISEIWLRIRDQVPYSVLYNEYQAYGARKDVTFRPRADELIEFDKVSFS